MNRIEPLRQLVAKVLDELDGVIALRRDVFGAAPELFTNKDDLSELAITPKYWRMNYGSRRAQFRETYGAAFRAWMENQ